MTLDRIDWEAADVVRELQARITATLRERLSALYLYGSLVSGGFDPGVSDVDLVAVTAGDLAAADHAALERMHRDFASVRPEWSDRVEVAYVTGIALKTFREERHTMAVISPGEPFNVKEAGREWLMSWYVVRETGVTLTGLPVRDVIAPVSRDEYVEAIREHADVIAKRAHGGLERKSQAHAIITMCRALYTHRTGGQPSKLEAARWAQQEMPEWSGLIGSALEWRAAWQEKGVNHGESMAETLEFVESVRRLVQGGEADQQGAS